MHLFIACFAALGAQINVANTIDNRINRVERFWIDSHIMSRRCSRFCAIDESGNMKRSSHWHKFLTDLTSHRSYVICPG